MTGAEINDQHMTELGGGLARIFKLSFDPEIGSTVVVEDPGGVATKPLVQIQVNGNGMKRHQETGRGEL
jgi:hypothetical protein